MVKFWPMLMVAWLRTQPKKISITTLGAKVTYKGPIIVIKKLTIATVRRLLHKTLPNQYSSLKTKIRIAADKDIMSVN